MANSETQQCPLKVEAWRHSNNISRYEVDIVLASQSLPVDFDCTESCPGPFEADLPPIETPRVPIVGRILTRANVALQGPTYMECPKNVSKPSPEPRA